MKTIIPLLALIFLIGCVTNPTISYDDVKRPPTTSVDVFREDQKPTKPYKEIGTVNREDFGGEEARAIRDLIKQAKAQGANAIIIQPRQDTRYEFIFNYEVLQKEAERRAYAWFRFYQDHFPKKPYYGRSHLILETRYVGHNT